jgi:hypothetical protein
MANMGERERGKELLLPQALDGCLDSCEDSKKRGEGEY